MTEPTKRSEGFEVLMDMKYSRIIAEMSREYGISLEEATDIFYNTPFTQLIMEGVADLNCRSDGYLAEEIWREHNISIS